MALGEILGMWSVGWVWGSQVNAPTLLGMFYSRGQFLGLWTMCLAGKDSSLVSKTDFKCGNTLYSSVSLISFEKVQGSFHSGAVFCSLTKIQRSLPSEQCDHVGQMNFTSATRHH